MSEKGDSQGSTTMPTTAQDEVAIVGAQQTSISCTDPVINEADVETEDEGVGHAEEKVDGQQHLTEIHHEAPLGLHQILNATSTAGTNDQRTLQTEHDIDTGRELSADLRDVEDLDGISLQRPDVVAEPGTESNVQLSLHDKNLRSASLSVDAQPSCQTEAIEGTDHSGSSGIVAENVMEVQTDDEEEITKTAVSVHTTRQKGSILTPPQTTQRAKRDRSSSGENTAQVISRGTKRTKIERQAVLEEPTSTTPITSIIGTETSKNPFKAPTSSSDSLLLFSKEFYETSKRLTQGQASRGKSALRQHTGNPSLRTTNVTAEDATPSKKANAAASFASSNDSYNVAITNSSITDRPGLMKFLDKHCQIQEKVNGTTDLLCVGEISTTSKLLLAVVTGITIVSDDWITKSAKAGKMLDPDDFLIRDDEFKGRYGRHLAEIPSDGGTDIFSDRLIYISPALKKVYGDGYGDIKNICIAAGARDVISQPARQLLKMGEDAAVIGLEQGDLDAIALHDHGHKIFLKDFLSHSIFSGKVRWDETFMITPGVAKGRRKRSGRAST